ncbi:hypothetical protein [Hoeflea sp.]|uniref:hypothetical protein n=1 Tax=Hoeflea sp. TaxID=1940281 RepID=UPI003B522680
MAQTFLGRLVLALQDNMSGKAKTTAASVNRSLNSIEKSAKALGDAPWGASFQQQLNKLGASRRELNEINTSWTRLQNTIKNQGLNKALAGSQIRAWKIATLSHLSQVRAGWKETEQSARRTARAVKESFTKPALVAMGGYTGAYLAGVGIREGFTAGSERRREQFRQDMASLTEAEKAQIDARATDLSQRYPSISKTDVMEMGRVSRSMMGDTERGLAVLDRMVQSFVTLQSTKGGEVAIREVTGFLRGLDNLGVNKNGAEGVRQVNEMIEAMVKASQIEGADFDAGTFWSFAKRSKVAGPALEQEFLAITPALMQDLGSDTVGNMLAMAFKAFVLEAVGSAGGKKYLAERSRIGLRDENGLIDSELFGRNPIDWTRKYLVPALEKDGVDMSNETAVSKAVGKLSGNTNATGLLGRFITQAEQIDRLKMLYDQAMGIGASDLASTNDPFVAYKAFKSAMSDLSAAVLPMETIAKGLNGIAGAVKSLAQAFEDGDPLARAGVVGGAAVGVGAPAFFLSKAIYGLITAGTNLNAAAVMLERAAIAQGGGALDGKGGKKGGWLGWLAAAGKAFGIGAAAGVTVEALSGTPGDTMEAKVANQRKYRKMLERMFGVGQVTSDQVRAEAMGWNKDQFSSGTYLRDLRSTIPSLNSAPHSLAAPFENATTGMNAAKSEPDLSGVVSDAERAGAEMKSALSVDAKPNVDTGSIDAAIVKARDLLSVLQQAGSAVSGVSSSTDAEMRRSMSDYGVTP